MLSKYHGFESKHLLKSCHVKSQNRLIVSNQTSRFRSSYNGTYAYPTGVDSPPQYLLNGQKAKNFKPKLWKQKETGKAVSNRVMELLKFVYGSTG